jgi:subtilisin family serine protease
MTALELVKLPPLMEQTTGHPEVAIGLIDGPVTKGHPDFESKNIRELPGANGGSCSQLSSVACRHGTFIAGMLVAKRNSAAAAICPGCRLLVRSIFPETMTGRNGNLPRAMPQELAAAILETVEAHARILNLSVALMPAASRGERDLQLALDYAAQRGVITVAAAGNHGAVGSSIVTRHPWVLPVTGCDLQGKPIGRSNLSSSLGKHGLLAPGESITGLGSDGQPIAFGGTSIAATFVTGSVALLYSEFLFAPATEILLSLRSVKRGRQTSIVPPLLNAWAAYQFMIGRGHKAESGKSEQSYEDARTK